MIEINPINNIFSCIKWDNEEQFRDIYNYFRIEDPSLKFTPSVRTGMSDGKKSFVGLNGQFFWGLKSKVIKYIESQGYEYVDNIPSIVEKIDDKEWDDFVKSIELPFEPHDYQIYGARMAIEEKRIIQLAATRAGKSLLLYFILRWFMYKGLKTLVIVPSVDLVNQMYSDFEEYTFMLENKLLKEYTIAEELRQYEINSQLARIRSNRKKYCFGREFNTYFNKIYAGKEKQTECEVTISTFQSIADLGPSGYFNQFEAMFADETHRAKSDSYILINKYTDCKWKIGLTGTLPPSLIDQLVLEGSFGKSFRLVTPKQLIERGIATPTHIQPVFLKYSKDTINMLHKADWQEQSKFFRYHQGRIDFIAKFAIKLSSKGNTMVLIKNVDLQKSIYELVKQIHENTFLISGSVKPEQREKIRKQFDSYSDGVTIASSQIMTTGITLASLKYIVFGQFTKAEIAAIQSIGRAMGLFDGKEESIVYDIVDDARYYSKTGKEYPNYAMSHFRERLDSYMKYEYPIKDIVTIQLEKELI